MNWYVPLAATFFTLLLRKLLDRAPKNPASIVGLTKAQLHAWSKKRPISCDICMSVWSTIIFNTEDPCVSPTILFATFCLTYLTLRAANKFTGLTNRLIDFTKDSSSLKTLFKGENNAEKRPDLSLLEEASTLSKEHGGSRSDSSTD